MLLCLQSNLDDFHWRHNRHCLGSTSSETSWRGGRGTGAERACSAAWSCGIKISRNQPRAHR
jgi:hypothetical protein